MDSLLMQQKIGGWVRRCFGSRTFVSREERCLRVLEEVLELCQVIGVDPCTIARLVEHVYGREVGQVGQEIAGVGITLLALCESFGVSLDCLVEEEYRRINEPSVIERCRRKQLEKRKFAITGDMEDTPGPEN